MSLLYLLGICFAAVLGILAIIFLVVPLLKGIGWMIGGLFNALGWLVRHVFEFIGGMLKDTVRFVGAIIAWLVLIPLVLLNVVIGRWSAAGHFFRSMKREVGVGTTCLYRVALQRPLRFVLLGGLLEGLEERVNEAYEAAPTSDKPRRRSGKFDGYTIVGSLPGGGSGAKLYVAEPDGTGRRKGPDLPPQVVIKSFTLTDGSSLPQIVRESRALEAAKQLGPASSTAGPTAGGSPVSTWRWPSATPGTCWPRSRATTARVSGTRTSSPTTSSCTTAGRTWSTWGW